MTASEPHPEQKEYIITEEQLLDLEGMHDSEYEISFLVATSLIRSQEHTPHQERERVLKIIKKIDPCGCPHKKCRNGDGHDGLNCRDCLISWIEKKLRSRGGGGG